MEITTQTHEGRHELQLKGRLDANWADHVGNAIESAIRAGHHHIDLDLAQVDYLSSAGIRVLLKYFKQLKAANGVLRVVRPIQNVLSVLELSGFDRLLVSDAPTSAPVESQIKIRNWKRNGVTFESYDKPESLGLEAHLHGHPEKFASGQLSAEECRRVRIDPDVVGLGLGAFGNDPADCAGRFGEFLAAGGTVVAQPTDGSSVPDFQVTEGQLVPEVNVLYGLSASGGFSRLLRFEATAADRGVIGLAELVEAALEDLKTSSAGFVVLAESANVVGATLRQSPILANGQSPLGFPAVRDWISFTTERTDERNLILVVGFAQREPLPASAAFLRAIGPGTNARGHFHAAVFPYRPLPKGNINMRETVTGLLATESARTVMHLLADEREFEGVGQTDLMRGACWIGPLRNFARSP